MPFITFSKRFGSQGKAKRIIENGKFGKDSKVVMRGRKTIRKIVDLAVASGFKSVLIVNNYDGERKAKATRIKITRKDNKTDCR